MAESTDEPNDSPAEHRKRRHDAWERAASAYEHAAEVHDDTAAFMHEHDQPEKAAEHERAADTDRRLADEARQSAQEQLDAPAGEEA